MIQLQEIINPAPIDDHLESICICFGWVRPAQYTKSTSLGMTLEPADPADPSQQSMLLMSVIMGSQMRYYAYRPNEEWIFPLQHNSEGKALRIGPGRDSTLSLIFELRPTSVNIGHLILLREAARRFIAQATDDK